jgi:hypothetical protein
MTERPSHTEPEDQAPMRVDRGSGASPPRWMTAVGIAIATLVILMFVVLHLTGVMGSGGH